MASASVPPTSSEHERIRVALPGPPLPRRRVARQLRELREQNGYLLEEVARRTRVSTSTLSRLENAQGSANPLTIRTLVEFYGLGDTERGDRLEQWAKDGRKPGWWHEYPEASEKIGGYVAYEAQATVAKLYVIPFIPVLLQTPDYSRALSDIYYPDAKPAERDRLLTFQQRRQEMLEPRSGREPLQLHVILHESCIRQRVGSRETMSRQLETLVSQVGTHSNIRLQVLLMDQEAHRAMNGTWTLFEYADDIDSNVAMLENPQGLVVAHLMDAASEVAEVSANFDELSRLSLSQAASLREIEDIRKQQFF